ncbi:uncharacterized protein TNCV_1392401 [Trichonephila clavipes]|nr:uncharacterized protein TNCV_1392401 [Trichonephila clavipes]
MASSTFDWWMLEPYSVVPKYTNLTNDSYPIMTQKSKLVTPDVVFNILNAELSSLATSFAISLNAGSALVENPSNLFVESFKTSPVLHVQDSQVPNSILVRLWVETFTQKVQDMLWMQNGSKPSIQMVYEACLRAERLALPAQRPERMPTLPERPVEPERMPNPLVEPERIPIPPSKPAQRLERIPTPPVEPERIPIPPVEPEIPAEPETPPMDNVKVTPPLFPRCCKGTQTLSPYFHVQRLDLGKRRMDIKEDASRRFLSVDASRECTMNQIDAFPEHISTTVMPVTLPEKPDALEYAARQGHVRACIIIRNPTRNGCLYCFAKTIGTKKRRCWIISSVPSWRPST